MPTKLTDALNTLFSVPAQASQKIDDVTDTLKEAKTAAVSYGTISIVLQIVSTASVALMAYCAYQSFCKRRK